MLCVKNVSVISGGLNLQLLLSRFRFRGDGVVFFIYTIYVILRQNEKPLKILHLDHFTGFLLMHSQSSLTANAR